MKQQTWLPEFLNEPISWITSTGNGIESLAGSDLSLILRPVDYWWSTEFLIGALPWFFFLSYQSACSLSGWYLTS